MKSKLYLLLQNIETKKQLFEGIKIDDEGTVIQNRNAHWQ